MMRCDANGNLVAKYHHDGGGLLAMTRNAQQYWYVFEAIGTVRQLTDTQSLIPDRKLGTLWLYFSSVGKDEGNKCIDGHPFLFPLFWAKGKRCCQLFLSEGETSQF